MGNLLTTAFSLSVITIVADKGSFSRDQGYIKKKYSLETRLTKIFENNPDRPTLFRNPGSLEGIGTVF